MRILRLATLVTLLAMPLASTAGVFRCPDGSYQDKPCDKGGGKAIDTKRGAVVRTSPDGPESTPGKAALQSRSCGELAKQREAIARQQEAGAGKARMEKLERARKDIDGVMTAKRCKS